MNYFNDFRFDNLEGLGELEEDHDLDYRDDLYELEMLSNFRCDLYNQSLSEDMSSNYMTRQPNQGMPPGPPPSHMPSQSPQLKSGPKLKAVDPGAIRPCRYQYVYIWPRYGRGFWAWLVYVGRRSASGYKWNGYRWVYFGMDLRDIVSFTCY